MYLFETFHSPPRATESIFGTQNGFRNPGVRAVVLGEAKASGGFILPK
jgi:hypothetical protein